MSITLPHSQQLRMWPWRLWRLGIVLFSLSSPLYMATREPVHHCDLLRSSTRSLDFTSKNHTTRTMSPLSDPSSEDYNYGYGFSTKYIRLRSDYDGDTFNVTYISVLNITSSERWTAPANASSTTIARELNGNGLYVIGNAFRSASQQLNASVFITKYDYVTRQVVGNWLLPGTATLSYFSQAAVVSRSTGSLYITGYVHNSISQRVSLFLAKYSSNGSQQYVITRGAAAGDIFAYGVACDDNDNVYVTGMATATFDGQIAGGNGDVFVAAFAADSSHRYTVVYGGAQRDRGWAIVSDTYTQRLWIGGDTQGGFHGQTEVAASDALLLCLYAANGSVVYTRIVGTFGNDHVYALALSSDAQHVFLTGSTAVAVDTSASASPAQEDVLLMKFWAADGSEVFFTSFGSANRSDRGLDVVVSREGFVYLTGEAGGHLNVSVSGTATVATALPDVFVAQYDTDGELLATATLAKYTSQERVTGQSLVLVGNRTLFVAGGVSYGSSGGVSGQTTRQSDVLFVRVKIILNEVVRSRGHPASVYIVGFTVFGVVMCCCCSSLIFFSIYKKEDLLRATVRVHPVVVPVVPQSV